jgi:hypothetical protein
MKIKSLTIGLLAYSIMMLSITSAIAADQTITVDDDTGDLLGENALGEEISTSDYIDVDDIDIEQIIFTKEGRKVTFTLKVKGEIQDRGDMSDIPHIYEFDQEVDVIAYDITLSTSEDDYDVIYVNQLCNLSVYSTEEFEYIEFEKQGNELTFSFNINSSDETDFSISAFSLYAKIPQINEEDLEDPNFDFESLVMELFYDDALYESEGDDPNGNGGTEPSNGDSNNGNNQDDGSGLLIFGSVIILVIIVGLVVVIYVIRR